MLSRKPTYDFSLSMLRICLRTIWLILARTDSDGLVGEYFFASSVMSCCCLRIAARVASLSPSSSKDSTSSTTSVISVWSSGVSTPGASGSGGFGFGLGFGFGAGLPVSPVMPPVPMIPPMSVVPSPSWLKSSMSCPNSSISFASRASIAAGSVGTSRLSKPKE